MVFIVYYGSKDALSSHNDPHCTNYNHAYSLRVQLHNKNAVFRNEKWCIEISKLVHEHG